MSRLSTLFGQVKGLLACFVGVASGINAQSSCPKVVVGLQSVRSRVRGDGFKDVVF